MADDPNKEVALPSEIVSSKGDAYMVIDALMGGTATMRAAAKKYLPQWPAEDSAAYQTRLQTATLFPAYSRTISVLTGKPFSKPITVGDDVTPRIKEWLENIDLEGRNLHAFAADLCAEALGYGFCGILVDCPPNAGAKTVADEVKAGVRPYFVHIKHDAVLGWRSEKRGAQMMLTQLRLLETVEEPKGIFSTQKVTQVRVLEPGVWTTYRKKKTESGDDFWVEFEKGTTSLDIIPFVPVYGFRKEFMDGVAPMMELAHMNVEHWQSKSDQQTILHVARVPLLFAKELGSGTPIVVGSGTFVNATSKDADLKYVEHTGAAIEAGRKSLIDLEERMRQAGAELLVIKPGNTTIVQTLSDNEQITCDLQRIVQTLEDALDQALDLMAKFAKETTGGHVTIYNDFGAATLAEASAQLLFEMEEAGSLSKPTLLSELKRRGIISADVDIDKEIVVARAEAQDRSAQRKENINV